MWTSPFLYVDNFIVEIHVTLLTTGGPPLKEGPNHHQVADPIEMKANLGKFVAVTGLLFLLKLDSNYCVFISYDREIRLMT